MEPPLKLGRRVDRKLLCLQMIYTIDELVIVKQEVVNAKDS